LDSQETPASSYTETTDRDPLQRFVEASKGLSLVDKYDDVRLAILPYAQVLARELNDQAPLMSMVPWLVNLYNGSDLDRDTSLDRLLQARAITQERTLAIRTPRPVGFGPRLNMAYLSAVLEDLIRQSLLGTRTADE
jgi:hypothetical protein